MRISACVVCAFSLSALAQSDPPPEVDQALRARVNEFFGYHVSGQFRKAEALVAEDTKDFYYDSVKNKLNSFSIGDITYSDNFTRAVVKVNVKRLMRLGPMFPETLMDQQTSTTWMIEGGKWVWYLAEDMRAPNPMGKSSVLRPADPGDAPRLPDLSDKANKERAKEILKQHGLDKNSINCDASKECTDKIVFHNGNSGTVLVYLDSSSPLEGFTAKLDKSQVNANEDAVLSVHWQPGSATPPERVILKLRLVPFAQTFAIAVNFAK